MSGFDAAGEGAVGEAGGELIAGGNLIGRADEAAPGIEHQRIATLKNGQRRERVQPRIEGADGGGGGMERALQCAVEARAAGGEALAGLGKPLARIVAQNSGGEIGDVALMLAELRADGVLHAEADVVPVLFEPMQERGHAALGAADGQAGETLAGLQQLEAGGALQAMGLRSEVLGNLVLGFGNQFGGSG